MTASVHRRNGAPVGHDRFFFFSGRVLSYLVAPELLAQNHNAAAISIVAGDPLTGDPEI